MIPVNVLTGFLGSGKTTLLRRWQREDSLRDAALIVHDLSEFGLDAELLAEKGAAPNAGSLIGRIAALIPPVADHRRTHSGPAFHAATFHSHSGRPQPPPRFRRWKCVHRKRTDTEVAAWQRGEFFPAPWPQSLKRFNCTKLTK